MPYDELVEEKGCPFNLKKRDVKLEIGAQRGSLRYVQKINFSPISYLCFSDQMCTSPSWIFAALHW